MVLKLFVTLLAATVMLLASIKPAIAASTTTSTTTLKQKPAAPTTPSNFKMGLSITRSTNLIDFQDGSRFDSIDYAILPSYRMDSGTISSSISYSQNLRDQYNNTAGGLGDIPLTFSFKTNTWKWNDNQNAKFSYSLTAIVPTSQYSVKKDQLQTAISGRVGFSVVPAEEGFSYYAALSLGRNFHAYEEDINGSVLNQYSSNQSIGCGYTLGNWNVGLDFTNRSRISYANNAKSVFEISEEIAYGVNEYISLAAGHTNAGSTLKSNGTDSNIAIYDENNSTVYFTLGLSY